MFESQIMICNQNISNQTTTNQISNLSNHKEKTLSLFSKKLPLEHREFGNDLTNLALTVFEKSSIASNKSILKALQIIKANAKNKERSREKSLIKNSFSFQKKRMSFNFFNTNSLIRISN